MLYRRLIRPLLYTLPPETAHLLVLRLLRVGQELPGLCLFTERLLRRGSEASKVRVFGRELASPIGLAAGFDKDAEVYRIMGALGFGFVEIGTVTAESQPGNPRPRLFRLPQDRALVNRMGFNSSGAQAVARKIGQRAAGDPMLGINIGKSKATAPKLALLDYERCAKRLGPLADYLVINVSSPNTPRLRDLQAPQELKPLLAHVQAVLRHEVGGRQVPLLVKIAPDLSDAEIDALADLALDMGLAGIVATNTTTHREGLRSSAAEVARCGAGGLSGPPLRQRALAVLERLRERVSDRLVLIAAGGVETAQDVWERLHAGATLVQLYTALVYEGPLVAHHLGRQLATLG
ncbi:MAG: quinone-dependent dihydroorotate dehydrogenase [Proteobacteria bacterium]|nr:quinone-dependent dihydroorotate dehydrogenase [Pseudomonadota bacterium]